MRHLEGGDDLGQWAIIPLVNPSILLPSAAGLS